MTEIFLGQAKEVMKMESLELKVVASGVVKKSFPLYAFEKEYLTTYEPQKGQCNVFYSFREY